MARHFKVHSADSAELEPAPPGERQIRRLVARVDALSPAAQYTLAAILIAIVFALDVITGPDIALTIRYLAPIAGLAWHRGWTAAWIAVIISGGAWLAADLITEHQYTTPIIQYWNALVRTAIFFVVAWTVKQLRRAVNEEMRLARTDNLTNVANSRWFMELAAREVSRQRRYRHPVTIAFLDCDNFKEVNDRWGHAAGDEMLRRVASCLRKTTREIDVVARLGGDEFAVLLVESDAHGARVACSKIRDALLTALRDFEVTFSIGLVTYLTTPDNVDDLLHAADQAMYEVKNSGKNSVRHRVIGEELADGTNA